VDRYAVFGNPIGHSKSPFIHAQFAAAQGEQLQYDAILAPLDGFADSWHSFVTAGGKGGNVTVPFKEQAYQLADALTARAKQAGAVNTLYLNREGKLCGDNTDGIGLIADLARLGVTVEDINILLLGAGGASRGAIGPLLDIPSQPYQLVINATSSGLSGERPLIAPQHLQHCLLAYDMLYGAAPTPFLQWAKAEGVPRQADGLGMLLSQAAEAFYIWRGKRPDITPVLAALKQQLSGN
jgi:shikimate dehydrogenase